MRNSRTTQLRTTEYLMPKKILLLDGHSLAYRAFYGLPLYDQGRRPRLLHQQW